jgi:biopolymer transport protein ExbD
MRHSSGFTVILSFLLVTVFFLQVPVHALENPVSQNLSATISIGQQDNSPSISVNSTTPVTIDPIPDHYVGDSFSLHGLADLEAGEKVLIQIQSAQTHPGIMIEGDNKSGMSSTAIVRRGKDFRSEWTYQVNMTGWMPGTYNVFVTPVNPRYNGSAVTRFNLAGHQVPVLEIPGSHPISLETPFGHNPPEITGSSTRPVSLPSAISVLAVLFVMLFYCYTRRS